MADRKHSKTKKRTQEEKPAKQGYYVFNTLTSIYLIIMFSFFTLFLTNKYATARHDKFYFFLSLTALFVIGAGIAYLLRKYTQEMSGDPLPPFFSPLSVPDIAMLAFFGCACISAVFSDHAADTFIAEVGRNNGVLLLFMYLLAYFTVSRMYAHRHYVIAGYLVFGSIIALLTLLNFFYIDPLGLLDGYSAEVAKDFGATIGNKNTIAAYMSLLVPASVMTFVVTEKTYLRVIAGIAIAHSYIGALSANSSSVILGLIIAVPVMAIFSARRYEYFMRYALGMGIMFAGGKLLRLFSFMLGGANKGFEFIQHFLIYDPLTYIPIFVFGAIFVLMYLFKAKAEPHYPRRKLTAILIALLCAGAALMLGAMVYFTAFDTQTPLGNLDRLLRFNDRWGTHRGFMWIRAMREYGKFNLFKILFGSGPDTMYFVLEPYFSELSARFGDGSTDCAHNEYINYLVTQGLFGLLSYLALVGGVCVRGIRRAIRQPVLLMFVSVILCYSVQATVNLYQPITTPLLILFISMAESVNRQNDLQKLNKI